MQNGSKITMGNFFSGSGTWELAAKMCGIALPTILPMMKSMADILRKGGD